jgi:hypothetical protein
MAAAGGRALDTMRPDPDSAPGVRAQDVFEIQWAILGYAYRDRPMGRP